MSQTLKPCPFCGYDKPTFERLGNPRQSCIVMCGSCGCRHESSDEGERCGSSWNDRAASPVTEARGDPVADDITLRHMNASLCDFSKRWNLDGDYLRCAKCKRPHIASAIDVEFNHRHGCKFESTSEHFPWRTLIDLLKPISAAPAPSGAVAADRIRTLLKEARSTLEMWKDVAPAVTLCADIDAALAAQPQEDDAREVEPLQGAANWLAEAHGQFCPTVLQGCLMIGYNRAKRLYDAAMSPATGAKGGG